jgi:hypothetical protein
MHSTGFHEGKSAGQNGLSQKEKAGWAPARR